MPIYKTKPTINFTTIDNKIICSTMPPVSYKVYSYFISKPADWQPRVTDIKKQLGLSAYAVRKALRWLCAAGYAFWVRLKTGRTIWHIFDKPQVSPQAETAYTPVIPPRVEFSCVESEPVLTITETETKKETTTPIPITAPPIPESNVVVSFEEKVIPDMADIADSEEKVELIYPPQLTPIQKKAAKAIIKKVRQPELQQPVLFALAYAITNGTVKSAPAYLQGLVTRANNGTFEPVGATTTTNHGGQPLIPIWQGFGQTKPSKPEVASGFIQQARAALRGIAL
jgi:hypothetical protein